jgi:hypothetical protein
VAPARHKAAREVAGQKDLDGDNHADDRDELQEEANESGLMPVQYELWGKFLIEGSSSRFGHLTRSIRIWFAWAIPPMSPDCLHLLESLVI